MGKAARFACILVPMVLTAISLCLGITLLLAGTKNIKGLQSFYQYKVLTKNLVLPETINLIPGTKLGPSVKTGFSKDDIKIKDFYYSYMFNYCSGDVKENDGVQSDEVTDCTAKKPDYVFDLEDLIQEHSETTVNFPAAANRAQKTVNIVSRFMVTCYTIATLCTGVTFLVGWFGLLSRWGSCITTIFATVAFGFFFLASACSTGLTSTIRTALNDALKDFHVEVTIGHNWLMATWCATGFALGAALFWLLSSFCCSGRTSKVMGEKHANNKTVKVEHTPYTYERVLSPYPTGSGTGVPLKPYGKESQSFEPMRHHV
jgi:hypothetical protein